MPRLHRIGGSHAQRDVVAQTLLAAGVHGAGADAGRQLLERRIGGPAGRVMTPLTAHWRALLGTVR